MFCLVELLGDQERAPIARPSPLLELSSILSISALRRVADVLSGVLVASAVEAQPDGGLGANRLWIIFVAPAKVLNLRPYRRRLILESGQGTRPETAALMKDIEL